MEDEKKSNPTPFYCNICKIYCASAINLQTHFLGVKHKAVEEALKAHGFVKPLGASVSSSGEAIRLPESLPDYVFTETEKPLGKTLEEQLTSCKDTEPALGLQYITEYRSKENPVYECHLCLCQAGVTNMFMHVLGIKHRMAYLKKHRPELADVKGRGSKLNLRLKEIAAKVEEEEGRQRIRSTMDLPIPKDDIYSVQLSDSLVTWFTEDDVGKEKKKEDPKSMAKEAEEVSNDKVDDSNKSEDKKESEKNTVQQQSTLFVESDSDSDEITNNEGLLKYLKSFEIVDEDDAAFILKVTQKLTDALILYRESASERKNFHQFGKAGDHSEQTSVGASGRPAKRRFSRWEPPAKPSFQGLGSNSSVKLPAKQKAPGLPTQDKIKTPKPVGVVSTFKEIPNDPDAGRPTKPKEPRLTSRDARRLGAGQGPENASRAFRDKHVGERARRLQTVKRRDATSSIPRRRDVPSSRRNQTRVPPSALSKSESNVVGKRFSTIRNKEVNEVADTESNPAFSGPRKTVWIIGHNIVYYAEDYATSSGWGSSLGLEDRLWIKWLGKKDMKWNDLLPTISLKVSLLGAPDALIIHLGENDLPEQKEVDLSITIAADLHTLNSRLHNTRFFWSDMLERRDWPGNTAPDKVDLIRRKITSEAGRLIEATGGIVIRHPDITFKHTALFKNDGIHLSEWGLDIWLHSVRHGLLCWLQS